MEKRDFGNGEISLLGFGLMRLPCINGQDDIDKRLALQMVDEAIAGGVNYFDTAYMYHGGQSENFAGEALSRYERSSYYLASKIPLGFLKSERDVEKIFSEQLKKCKTGYFDFYLLHGIMQNTLGIIRDYRVYEQLLKMKEEGLIRRLGFSFHDRPELLRKLVDEHEYDFAQIQLNYADWELQGAKEQYEILAAKKIPVHIMEPVRGGALATLNSEAIRIFKEADPAASPASWAIRYAASLPAVQVVLSGMTTMEQLKDNIAVMSPLQPLTERERTIVGKALTAYRKGATVPCTGCRYCMDCPSGVNIPKVLAAFNGREYFASVNDPGTDFHFIVDYGLLKEEEQAKYCVSCGQCTERCPQHIDIPYWLKQTVELYERLRGK
jgi:predicted aldo/keto reductase-like oxidoreductase